MRNPRALARPLAAAAPAPLLEIPVAPRRAIHFFDPPSEPMTAKLGARAARADDATWKQCRALVARDPHLASRHGLA